MSEPGWTPEERERRRLPRLEDLPTAAEGYDPQAVREAFDSFYRHAADLDATLRTLEAVEAFQRQAAELRSDIRSLRAASWGPAPPVRGESWHVGYRRRARTGPAGAISDAFPRVVVETAFILVVAVGAAVAGVSTPLVVALVAAAWVIVGAAEVVASVAGPRLRRRRGIPMPAAREPAPTVVAPPLPAETGEQPAVEPEPGPAPVVEPEPSAVVEPPKADEAAVVEVPEAEEEGEEEPAAVPLEPEPEPEEPAPEPAQAAAPGWPEPGDDEREQAAPPVLEPEPQPVERAAAPSVDPWEAGPELPDAEREPDAAQEPPARFRFWRSRRRTPEEQALLPEPTGHVQVISVRPAVPPEQVRVPWDAGAAEQALEGVESAEGWTPPAEYRRPAAARLRRGRR